MPRELPIPPTVTAETRNIEYTELNANITVAAGNTEGSATLTLPASDVNIQSIRVYPPDGYTGRYTVEITDSNGKAVYRFRDRLGELVDLNGVIVHDDNSQLIVKITLPSAAGSDMQFNVKIGLSYIA